MRPTLLGYIVKKSISVRKAIESRKPQTADEIAKLAGRGEDSSRYFTNTGGMMPPILQAKKELAAFYTKYDIIER